MASPKDIAPTLAQAALDAEGERSPNLYAKYAELKTAAEAFKTAFTAEDATLVSITETATALCALV